MNLTDTVGVVGIIFLFIKIGIHIYIKRKVDKKFRVGAFGQFTNPILFFPITDIVSGYLKPVRILGNITYIIAIILILIFLIGTNFH